MSCANKPLDGAGLAVVNEIINGRLSAKQDKLTGTAGQVVGFDATGSAVAQEAGEVYSTEETRIGTWIDGRPVYQITAVVDADPDIGQATIFENPGIDALVGVSGYRVASDDTDSYCSPIGTDNPLSESTFVSLDHGSVTIGDIHGGGYQVKYFVTLKYIKSSGSAPA